jgi:hypothetical protein
VPAARWGYDDDIDIYDHRSVYDDLHRAAYKLIYHDDRPARNNASGKHHDDRSDDIDINQYLQSVNQHINDHHKLVAEFYDIVNDQHDDDDSAAVHDYVEHHDTTDFDNLDHVHHLDNGPDYDFQYNVHHLNEHVNEHTARFDHIDHKLDHIIDKLDRPGVYDDEFNDLIDRAADEYEHDDDQHHHYDAP